MPIWAISLSYLKNINYDAETGLYYLQSRYYDPAFGRFINADDPAVLLDEDAGIIGGLNLYAYCNNNPVIFTDPSGYSFVITLIVGAILAGLISGAINAGMAANNGENVLAAFAGGLISGTAMGAASILGGGLAVGAFKITAASIAGTVAYLSIGTFAMGVAAYYTENGIERKEFNWRDAFKNGALTMTQGLFSFGIGAAMGVAGFYESLKPGNGFFNTITKGLDTCLIEAGKMGVVSGIGHGAISYFVTNLWSMIVRTFMRNIFTFPWNLIKP